MGSERHQLVMNILADAIECDYAERDHLLTAACKDDESLRLEVECLLQHETPSQGFMEESLIDETKQLFTDNEELLIGKQIGSYLITEVIGRGGMGIVYLAMRSDDEYQKQVAIKLINRGMDSDLIQRRFRNERQILADLDHQNIARLLDGGTTQDGRSFLVMEYVSGHPIDAYAELRELSTTERLKLFLTVCDAVEYAHQNHVIHRDIKPSNVLVNQEGVPKLLDFGIAKVLRPDSPASTVDATTSAWRVLTPEYASPEQIRGDQSTAATDIYSLGAVLYELLTGQRPHRRMTRGSSPETSHEAATREPEKPSAIVRKTKKPVTRGPQARRLTRESVSEAQDGTPELRRRLRGDLDNILLMALKGDPARRYASVAEFSDDLRRHLKQQPVRARRDSIAYRGRKFVQRNRASVISASAVAILCLMIGLSLNFVNRQPKPAVTSIAVLPFVNVGSGPETQYLADGLSMSLIGYLSRLPNLNVPGHNSVSRYEVQAIDPSAAARALHVNTVLLGRVNTSGETLSIQVEILDSSTKQIIWSKRFDGKVKEILPLQHQVAEEVARSLGLSISSEARLQNQRANTHNAEAYRLYLRGNYFWNLRSELGTGKAIEQFQEAIVHDPDYALAYSGIANSYSLIGAYRWSKPDEVFPKAKAAALKALELNSELPEAHTSLAMVQWLYEWDWPAADRSFRRSIELHPGYVTAHHWYGLYLAEMGRFDEAIASEKRALDLDPLSVYVNADLGRVYYYARRYTESLAQYRKTLVMNPNFNGFYFELAQLYEKTGDFDEYIGAGLINATDANGQRELFAGEGFDSYWRRVLSDRLAVGTELPWYQQFEMARISARLGKSDYAIRMLRECYQLRDHLMIQIKVDPAFDSLRSDPRFKELLRRMRMDSSFEPIR